ncbi:MAG: 3-methyl-2-oxobutanoate dehydrogenase subunit VorB [Bacteroidales bacterium]|jgi:2-oxoglutarate ferredoxin oxidoreductase subunit alpha|nr:3-methyl-2-oxobutanoate dehydrogenase subunit VorB [Bacteroidales bacterium]
MKELRLLKGNEAVAEAAIRAGADAYFGYPITPQSEIMEYLVDRQPETTTGMVILQAESEVAAINMVYGASAAGRRVMTSSSSPGISLMTEGISYLAGAELPCLIVNVTRGGPGLGTIQPSQADYFQSVKGGGHGDYRLLVLAPASVQEMADFVALGFDLAFKYRNPVMMLADGVIGQMMEKVELPKPLPKRETVEAWAVTGKTPERERNVITSLNLDALKHERHNLKLQAKYRQMEREDTRYDTYLCNDAEYIITAYGASARISKKTVDLARDKGIKVGLFRPVTLFPFPSKELATVSQHVEGILSVEMSAGQMIEDVLLATRCRVPVRHFGRNGGVVHAPGEILEALEQFINSKEKQHQE